MALEILRWTRDGRVINIAVRGSNVRDDDYDPAHQEVIDIPDQRHADPDLRILEGAARTLRLKTNAEKLAEPAREAVDDTLVDGPTGRA